MYLKMKTDKKLLNDPTTWISNGILFFILLDSIFIPRYMDWVHLAFVGAWIYIIRISTFARLIYLPFSLVIGLMIPLFLIVDRPLTAEKFSIWLFYLLSIVIIVRVIESRSIQE